LDKDSKLHGKNFHSLDDHHKHTLKIIGLDSNIGHAIEAFDHGAEVVGVVDGDNKLIGLLYEGKFTSAIQTKKLGHNDSVKRALIKEIGMVCSETDLSIVQRFLDRHPVCIVCDKKDGKSHYYYVKGRDLIKYYK